jgi:hypothetical protein
MGKFSVTEGRSKPRRPIQAFIWQGSTCIDMSVCMYGHEKPTYSQQEEERDEQKEVSSRFLVKKKCDIPQRLSIVRKTYHSVNKRNKSRDRKANYSCLEPEKTFQILRTPETQSTPSKNTERKQPRSTPSKRTTKAKKNMFPQNSNKSKLTIEYSPSLRTNFLTS